MLTRLLSVAGVLAVAALVGIKPVSAQDLRGFAGGGVISDVNGQVFPAFGGGALIDLGQPWISAGGQGEAFVSWPYFAGRGAMFAQANVIPKGPVRPFLLGGVGMGEYSGPMIGAGVEFGPRIKGQPGFRIAVEDYLAQVERFRGTVRTEHQLGVRVGLVFR